MPKQFCQSCGSGTQYEMNRPKFCASCGTPFGGTVIPAKKSVAAKPQAVDFDDEDDKEMEIPEVENIFANNFIPQRKVLTLGDIRDGAIPSVSGSIAATSLAECRRIERESKPGKRKPIEIA